MAYQVGRPGEGENSETFVLSGATERVSWGAIFAGAVAALAVQVLLALLGLGLGFAVMGDAEGETVGNGALIYWLVAGIASLFTGGFVAGRMAGVPLPTAAVLQGAMVWSVVTVFSAVLAVSGASAFVSGASRMALELTDDASSMAGDLGDMLPAEMSDMLPSDMTASFQQALEDRDLTAENIRQEAREMLSAVIDESEREQAATIARETGRDILNSPSDMGEDISRGLDRLIGANGVIGPDDRQALIDQMSQRFELDAGEAEEIVDNWSETLVASGEEAAAAYEDLREEASAFADEAAESAASAAFWAAVVTFFGLVAACAGAIMGRPEDFMEVEVAERRAAAAS